MKHRRTHLIIGGIIFTFLVSIGLASFSGCGHHPFHKRDFSKHVLKRMDRRVKKLNLSDSQKIKYEEIRSKVQANMTEARHERERLFEALKIEINGENPDIEAIAGLLKNRLKAFSPIMEENIDYFSDFYKILDEDQRAKVLTKLRKKLRRI